ncbi:helix-turn-helix domain-containing protein [Pseudomonas typographi]|uniref:Helix-turn-helix domain-containing protein n=1 Tax=Pseudomonas typographi TaxID=2715964 RepID=A0ABR7YZG0_9PSED|nr:helix-turn-helix domain-containing protein [Pseudomonas typographi]MBD1586713.1 helix-turn-helix domain-containing protein [Pseudomonas typographi]MBD1598606.1 helix-turn-helix domain-containing protein [Pseudomonas typographi]
MSMELMVKAMKTQVGNPLRKLVLIKLADNASDQGECWPSYQHIADQCEISRSTVKVHIRELEKAGLLRREFRRNGELNQSNVFHLTLENGAADARGGASENPPGASENPGGRAAAAPRTSHSFEPVNEPTPLCKPDPMEGFDQFWKLYPKKRSLKDAKKAWAKLKPDAELRQTLITALGRQRLQHDWTKSDGQYVPLASTWLNGEKWNDDVGPPAGAGTDKPSRHTDLHLIDHTAGLELGADGNYRIAGAGQ